MEKIKKALEKARMARSQDHDLGFKHDSPKKSSVSEDCSAIVYSQTKTVDLNKEILREKRVIVGSVSELVMDQYKVLRTHVVQKMKMNQWNTLAITSPIEGCGKTLTSINLSISLARDVNHSVLLVDMDLRHPSIHTYFEDINGPGIGDYLTGEIQLNEILFNPGLERLVVLPGSRPIENSSEMLSSPKSVHLINELKNRYKNRLVIFDMPPVLSCDDMIAFAPYVDAVMIVVEEGTTRKEDLKRSCDLMNNSNILGTVLNKSKTTENIYSY